jgi:hypothetical protein
MPLIPIARWLMATRTESRDPGDRHGETSILSTAETLQLWQHFVSTAGDDKNRMITLTIWLVGLSASIVGYVTTQSVDASTKIGLGRLGIVVSVLAVYVVGLYWLHERWNRRKAETLLAKVAVLKELLPSNDRPLGGVWVFGLFLALALGSLILHIKWAAG